MRQANNANVTIVAGARGMVEAVLADSRFAAYQVAEDAELSYQNRC